MPQRTNCLLSKDVDMLKYQAIAIDIDGTLLNDEKKISSQNYQAIRRYVEAGGKVILTSGRLPISVGWHAKLLGLENLYISLNGTIITYRKITKKSFIELPAAIEFIKYCKNQQLYCQLYTSNGIIVDKLCSWNIGWSEKNAAWLDNNTSMPSNMKKIGNYCPIQFVDDFTHYLSSKNPSIHKIVVLSSYPISNSINNIPTIPNITITSSDASNLEIIPLGAGKGSALLQLCGKLAIEPKNIMAIGDNCNDLSMFNSAGLSIAMGNAPQEVKNTAHHVTLTNNDSGVAYAINTWAYRS